MTRDLIIRVLGILALVLAVVAFALPGAQAELIAAAIIALALALLI